MSGIVQPQELNIIISIMSIQIPFNDLWKAFMAYLVADENRIILDTKGEWSPTRTH